MTRTIRVLSLQPYFGGSHAQFHRGWVENSSLHWTTLTLPARHWKWRMRQAGIYFAEEIRKLTSEGQSWDAIFCSDMLNVAEFKGLVEPPIRELPLIVYFHENQFAYPSRVNDIRDEHFPFTNFVSALAADRIWFNSKFNLDSMLAGLRRQANSWPDYPPKTAIESLSPKTEIQPPGIRVPPIHLKDAFDRRATRARNKQPIHIVWAARWEHDKNPEGLLEALELLDRDGVPFQLSVLGQSFRDSPPAFEKLRTTFSSRIVRWGYQETRGEYWRALADADVFVSTAHHEFFGLAAAEAIAVGLNPLLPARLAYPELIALAVDDPDRENCFYSGSPASLCRALKVLASLRTSGKWQIDQLVALRLIDRIGWTLRGIEMDEAVKQLLLGHRC
jgi:glycosyltransferase involved in cell wall biosynthesis